MEMDEIKTGKAAPFMFRVFNDANKKWPGIVPGLPTLVCKNIMDVLPFELEELATCNTILDGHDLAYSFCEGIPKSAIRLFCQWLAAKREVRVSAGIFIASVEVYARWGAISMPASGWVDRPAALLTPVRTPSLLPVRHTMGCCCLLS